MLHSMILLYFTKMKSDKKFQQKNTWDACISNIICKDA
jgi:hypothetical protein